jgi:hypothetical protein
VSPSYWEPEAAAVDFFVKVNPKEVELEDEGLVSS